MTRGPIDLHTHSSVSDGTETPTQLIRAAVEAGLDTVAITDHDSTAGWDEALTAAAGTGLQVIRGIELSTRHEWRSVHLLGYLFDPHDPVILRETARTRDDRLTRAERMVARLAEDFDITWDDVLAQSGGTTIGRPHIADALVARGVVPTRSAAFESILHFRGGYYLPHEAPTVLDGVRMIAEAGGEHARRAGAAARAGCPVRPRRHGVERLPRRRQAQPSRREHDDARGPRAPHRRDPRRGARAGVTGLL